MKKILPFLVFVLLEAKASSAPLIEKHEQRDFIFRSLHRLVDTSAKTIENHFFFVKRKNGHDWVYWREGHLLWETDLSPYYEKKGKTEIRAQSVWDLRLYTPHKPIDLDEDVVAKTEDIHGSTYLVTKAFVSDIIYDCVQDGELVVIEKSK